MNYTSRCKTSLDIMYSCTEYNDAWQTAVWVMYAALWKVGQFPCLKNNVSRNVSCGCFVSAYRAEVG